MPFFVRPVTRGVATKLETSFILPNLATHFDFVEGTLAASASKASKAKARGSESFLCGERLTGADVMMVYPLESAAGRMDGFADRYPHCAEYVKRLQGREAYKRAVQRIVKETGEYNPNLL